MIGVKRSLMRIRFFLQTPLRMFKSSDWTCPVLVDWAIKLFIGILRIFTALQPDVTETFEHTDNLLTLYVRPYCVPRCVTLDFGTHKSPTYLLYWTSPCFKVWKRLKLSFIAKNPGSFRVIIETHTFATDPMFFPQGPSKKKKALENPRLLVGAEGVEPPTLCL